MLLPTCQEKSGWVFDLLPADINKVKGPLDQQLPGVARQTVLRTYTIGRLESDGFDKEFSSVLLEFSRPQERRYAYNFFKRIVPSAEVLQMHACV